MYEARRRKGELPPGSLRAEMLALSPSQAQIFPTRTYPRVFGVVLDWPTGGEQVASVIARCDGYACLVSNSSAAVLGGAVSPARLAAQVLVASADWFYAEATLTVAFPYPARDRVRFYLLTYGGVRVIDAGLAAATGIQGKYWELFDLAQHVAAKLRADAGG